MTYLICFWEFFKVGLFAIGGGLATIPFFKEMAARYPQWFTEEELINFIAVSESTPGPIGINLSTYVGFKIGGPFVAVMCTFSIVLPSFILIMLIARALERFKNSSLVDGVFYGIRPSTSALILSATLTTFIGMLINLGKITAVSDAAEALNIPNILLFAVILAAALIFDKLHPLAFIAAGAAAGVIFSL